MEQGEKCTYEFIVRAGVELHMQVRSFSGRGFSWVYRDNCPIKTPALGPVASRKNSVP